MNVSLRWNTTGITVAGVTRVGTFASNNLYMPLGLALDATDALIIADQYNNRIQKWITAATSGATLAGQANGVAGATSNTLNWPNSVLVNSNNSLYIVDTNNHRVQFWANGATSEVTVAGTGTVF